MGVLSQKLLFGGIVGASGRHNKYIYLNILFNSAMLATCAAYGCTSRGVPGSDIHFYRFPSVKYDRQCNEAWITSSKVGVLTKRINLVVLSEEHVMLSAGQRTSVCFVLVLSNNSSVVTKLVLWLFFFLGCAFCICFQMTTTTNCGQVPLRSTQSQRNYAVYLGVFYISEELP